MLSAATMFSLLALPAYAIVPGEDAYGGAQEEGYIRVDFENQTREFIPNSEIPEFTGNSTYDVLSPNVIGVAGYPQDYLDQNPPQYQFLRKIGLGCANMYDGIILAHDADTTAGQSGGPFMTNVMTGNLVGYGIHLYGVSRADGSGIENYARAIIPEIYNTIVIIMEDS